MEMAKTAMFLNTVENEKKLSPMPSNLNNPCFSSLPNEFLPTSTNNQLCQIPLGKTFLDNFLLRTTFFSQLQQQLLAAKTENSMLEQAKLVERNALEMALLKENCEVLEKRQKSDKSAENEEHFLTRCGITWKFLTTVRSQREFDELRRKHQVSKNRHVGYGVRYACTRNAKARDNCPYLMLCMQNKNGLLKVYYRNEHTHPIRHIRTRDSQN